MIEAAPWPPAPPSPRKDFAAWLVRHEAAGCLAESFTAWADPEERTRAARFHRECDRVAYAISHAALRLVLGAVTERPPAAVRFARLAGGKPVLVGEKRAPSFSLSHTTGATLIAVSREFEIGADIEAMPVNFDADLVLTSIAAEDEAARLRSATAPGQLAAAVLRLWVVKEAALKLDGGGLALDPKHVVAEARSSTVLEVCATADGLDFTPSLVRTLDAGAGFSAAIALSVNPALGCPRSESVLQPVLPV